MAYKRDPSPSQTTPTHAEPEVQRIPRVRVTQDNDAQPVRVAVVEEYSREPSLGLFAAIIFIATLMGTLIGLGADFGELIGSVNQMRNVVDPPPQLCVAGSNTVLGEGITAAQEWEAAFEADHRVNVRINGLGSTGGVRAAVAGECVHILAMSEPMTEAHYADLTGAGIEIDCAAEIGYDVIAFITNVNNPIVAEVRDPDDASDDRPMSRPIPLGDLRAILTGNIRDWSDLNNWPDEAGSLPITIWLRRNSGTSELILIRLAGFEPSDALPYPLDVNYQFCEDGLDCLNKTLDTPGSLLWISAAWMRTQPENYLKVLDIISGDERATNPLAEEVDLDEYPNQFIRPLYFYVLGGDRINPDSNRLARDFLAYVRGVQGQQIVDANSFYNHFSRPVDVEVPFPEPIFDIPAAGLRTICK